MCCFHFDDAVLLAVQELHLIEKNWAAIRKRMTSILQRLQEAAEQSYQIKLAVGPQQVGEIFDRHAGQQQQGETPIGRSEW